METKSSHFSHNVKYMWKLSLLILELLPMLVESIQLNAAWDVVELSCVVFGDY